MTLLGNILWLICGGFFVGLGYIVYGGLFCVTIVGIPFGLQAIKLGFATFCPFGKEIKEGPNADSTLRVLFNLIWLILFGWQIALAHASGALVCAVTIIGIPFALQHVKLIPLSLMPFGRDLV